MAGGFYLFSDIFTTTCISSLAYGFHMCIASSTLVVLAKQGNQDPHRVAHIIFVLLLFLLGTINISIHLDSLVYHLQSISQGDIDNVQAIVELCLDPTPPPWLFKAGISLDCLKGSLLSVGTQIPYTREIASSLDPGFDRARGQETPALFISIFAQSYLILRCHSLWGKRFVTVAMSVLLPVVIAFGILNIYFLPPDREIITRNPWHIAWTTDTPGFTEVLARVYWGLALGYNISANALIVGRLLWLRAKVTSAMGNEFGKLYTGLAAMLMESSALYSVVLILGYTALPVGDGGSSSLFSPLVAQTEAVAVELIILRLALRRND